jgi:hypothetical protein
LLANPQALWSCLEQMHAVHQILLIQKDVLAIVCTGSENQIFSSAWVAVIHLLSSTSSTIIISSSSPTHSTSYCHKSRGKCGGNRAAVQEMMVSMMMIAQRWWWIR